MSEFKTYHPIVNFTYFVFVIGFSCFLVHPICLCISLLCGFLYSVILKGDTKKTNLAYILPIFIFTALINPVFNHEGATIICYLPSKNPLTLESVIYGLCAAAMLIGVICHFSCYNEIMTSDKFIYLFGKIIPAASLVFSMTLRFVPRFSAQLKNIKNAQRAIGKDMSNGSILRRIKHGLAILSAMITWSLENAIETADSMKARGYGIPGRTAFSVFKFHRRDKRVLALIIFLGIYTLTGAAFGKISFRYFPTMHSGNISIYGISVFISYFLLCMCPIIIEFREAMRWKKSRSKI